MNKDLILGVLFLMGAGLFYLLPKSVMGNADDPTFESINRVKKIRRWIFIVACVIMSIISFCKAI
jgi:hypothetical protein